MTLTILFAGVLVLAAFVAFADPHRGWYLAILLGILQDPLRKLTPGTPVVLSLTAAFIYAAILLGAQARLLAAYAEFRMRYPRISKLLGLFFWILIFAAVNGLMTFGLSNWEVPALGLFIYCLPLPAVIFGYFFLRSEEQLLRFFTFFAVITAIALIGVPLEYYKIGWRTLGTVALQGDWIRHIPGIQIRILSGFYRSPDIMAWHAAMLCCISIFMIIRKGFPRAWLWMILAAWGFLTCLMSGRRKMIYMIAVFVAVFLFRFIKRLTVAQVSALVFAGLAMAFVYSRLKTDERSNVYVIGAATSRGEVLQRIEGGAVGTLRQSGVFGLGIGSATQGAYRLARTREVGWQEGGLGKLALELGLPGLLFAIYFGYVLARTFMRISAARDHNHELSPTRIALVGLVAANGVAFLISHQPFIDPVLVLMNAFLIGVTFRLPHLGGASDRVHPPGDLFGAAAPYPQSAPLPVRGTGA